MVLKLRPTPLLQVKNGLANNKNPISRHLRAKLPAQTPTKELLGHLASLSRLTYSATYPGKPIPRSPVIAQALEHFQLSVGSLDELTSKDGIQGDSGLFFEINLRQALSASKGDPKIAIGRNFNFPLLAASQQLDGRLSIINNELPERTSDDPIVRRESDDLGRLLRVVKRGLARVDTLQLQRFNRMSEANSSLYSVEIPLIVAGKFDVLPLVVETSRRRNAKLAETPTDVSIRLDIPLDQQRKLSAKLIYNEKSLRIYLWASDPNLRQLIQDNLPRLKSLLPLVESTEFVLAVQYLLDLDEPICRDRRLAEQ